MVTYDVAVVGAGPAGSSLATVLADRDWNVLLLERDRFPRHKVCGEFLSPESQASLDAMGLYRAVAALSPAPMDRVRFVSPRGIRLDVPLPGEAWGVSRHALDATLARTAVRRGAELRTGMRVTGFTRVGAAVEVKLRTNEGARTVRVRALVVACGRHSAGDLPPDSSAAGERQQYVGVKCHYANVALPSQVELYLFPGGYAGVGCIEGARVNVCLLASYAAFARAGKSVSAMIAAAGMWNHAFGRRLAGATALPETEVAVAPVDTGRAAIPWDRTACLGDTAVMIPPLVGDGIAMALRSAELCAPPAHDFLRGRRTRAEWQQAYCAAWQHEFSHRVRIARLIERGLARPLFSDALIGLGRAVPALPAYLVRVTRGLPTG